MLGGDVFGVGQLLGRLSGQRLVRAGQHGLEVVGGAVHVGGDGQEGSADRAVGEAVAGYLGDGAGALGGLGVRGGERGHGVCLRLESGAGAAGQFGARAARWRGARVARFAAPGGLSW